MEHPVPRRTASWAYVFGSARPYRDDPVSLSPASASRSSYVPPRTAPGTASKPSTINSVWMVHRALHGWGSNFMVALVIIHMVQVFLFGAFKFPRELTWMVGVLLLLMTLGMASPGRSCASTRNAYWGLGIGASVMGRMPFVGPKLVHLMFAVLS